MAHINPNNPIARTRLQSEFGLQCWSGQPLLMDRGHRHNDLELNWIGAGEAVYLFGGRRLTMRAGELCLFWAASPHQMIECAPGTTMHWVTLPLAWSVRRGLPPAMMTALLQGKVLLSHSLPYDTAFLKRWQQDLRASDGRRELVLLELEARLRRMALELIPEKRRSSLGILGAPKAEEMARIIATRFHESLSAGRIAREVGLHPNYAMSLFRQTYGDTLVERITQHRVAYAQQLLVTTQATVLDIAMRAGFGSATQFYAAFESICGQSPSAYRRSIQSLDPA